ncbi:MAG: hypothetical protein ACJ77K_15375 [Bacteroidia bacterium]|jgi:hypothetical protein
MENKEHLFKEAELISRYLLGITAGEKDKLVYADAMNKLNIPFSEYEQVLWNNMMKSRMRMAFIDAGLALREPSNNARRKVFTMLAILEASPDHTEYFLSRDFSFFYRIRIGFAGIRAIWRAVVGTVIIRNIKRRCS